MALSLNGSSGISGIDGSAGTPALQGSDSNTGISFGTDEVSINTGGTTRAKVDSSGRLLAGTSSSSRQTRVSVTGNSGGASNEHGIIDLQFSGTAPGTGFALGYLNFADTSTGNAARIGAERDSGTWTSGSSMPGRLVFLTTADGASSPTEKMRISANGQLYTGLSAFSPYNNTVVNAANAHIGADGVLYRSTSSARFKTDVETLENQYADALLSCRPVWYRSIAPGDSQHPDWGYWGFIAEEVGEIDPRLVFWKTHETEKDEDGNTVQVELEEPIAEGVQYDRFVPHLLNLIKRQKEQIEAMEARLTALEGGTNP